MKVRLATAKRTPYWMWRELPEFTLSEGDKIELRRFEELSYLYGDAEKETMGMGTHAEIKVNGMDMFRFAFPDDALLVEIADGKMRRLPDSFTA